MRILSFLLIPLAALFTGCSDDDALDTTLSTQQLSELEVADLQFLREEEKLAHDVYTYAFERFGVSIFSNIAASEQTHTDAVLDLMTAYQVEDSASQSMGVFNNAELAWDAALPRICTYAQLKERASARQFWHFNTHFDHMGQEARAESATLIINEIKRLTEPKSAIVVTGDFNAQPQELPIVRMKEAMIDPLDQLELKGPMGTFSGFRLDAPLDRRIDYIFVQGLTPTSYEHLGEKRANGRWISDHLAVKVRAKF